MELLFVISVCAFILNIIISTLVDCESLYIYVGKSTLEFKLIRPISCPSVLLTLKGQKDMIPYPH